MPKIPSPTITTRECRMLASQSANMANSPTSTESNPRPNSSTSINRQTGRCQTNLAHFLDLQPFRKRLRLDTSIGRLQRMASWLACIDMRCHLGHFRVGTEKHEVPRRHRPRHWLAASLVSISNSRSNSTKDLHRPPGLRKYFSTTSTSLPDRYANTQHRFASNHKAGDSTVPSASANGLFGVTCPAWPRLTVAGPQ